MPLRARLVAGFLVAMLVVLTAAGAFVYWRVQYALDRGLDAELDRAGRTIDPLVGPDGVVTDAAAADATGAGWQVLDETGRVLDSGGPAPTEPMATPRDLVGVGAGTLTKDLGTFLPVAAEPLRVHVTSVGPARTFLVVGVGRNGRDEALRELLVQLALAGLGTLVVTAVVGDVLARTALRPVERYRRRAADIAGGADGLRLDVPTGRDDEVTRLGHTLNDMLASLERSLSHERRFVDEASHELRTPLTLLTSRIQLARRRPRSTEEHEAVLDELAVDVARLADLADQLLALGAADQPGGTETDTTRIATILEHRVLARPEQAHQLSVQLPTTPARVAVDPIVLERIVTNLVDNAFAHGRPPVRIRVHRVTTDELAAPGEPGEPAEPGDSAGPAWALVQVDDAGPGMPADLLGAATDRFTRAPEARARPGAGLGLSLVEQLVTAAGGELRLCHGSSHTTHGHPVPVGCEHGTGMTVSVFLPSPP